MKIKKKLGKEKKFFASENFPLRFLPSSREGEPRFSPLPTLYFRQLRLANGDYELSRRGRTDGALSKRHLRQERRRIDFDAPIAVVVAVVSLDLLRFFRRRLASSFSAAAALRGRARGHAQEGSPGLQGGLRQGHERESSFEFL